MANKTFKTRKLNLYSNLANSRKAKSVNESGRYSEYLAGLPRDRWQRFFYRINPNNAAKFWFSRHGMMTALKVLGVMALIFCLTVGGMFIFFRKDLDSIRPGELSKLVKTTANTYLDRNGKVLWVDKGIGNYQLVVNDSNISKYIKEATVSIEDKDFYKHGGISASGLMRAVVNNVSGGSTQGGSTLTQQLVKQVFFADEASQRGIAGIPRKIKEIFLSIEVERMYNKNQILDLYLNESPYGGRRNGVESAAQTYFGKSAKDLTLAEAALLAAIPQNPSYYNPYNVSGHDALIARQHRVLDDMVSQGYITKKQATEAKNYPILDHINPEADQYSDIKAPHFIQMVRSELIKKLGATVVGKGGLTVTTTLDVRIQDKLEEAVDDMFNSSKPAWAGFNNAAATVEDTKTGQIVALIGSRDYNYPAYGQDNAATAYLQPGSSIKPFVYATLFQKRSGVNYGSGSILNDTNIDSVYGAPLFNADRKFKGPITIRSALATSRNIPAVEAMYISGVKTTVDNIHKLGADSYCTEGTDAQAGLSAAIGGCGIEQVDLVNAYASLSRGGVYKPQSTVLKVSTTSNESLFKWSDTAGTRIIDSQSAYIVSDILNDEKARQPLDGYHAVGMYIPEVKTSTKTGTSDKGGNAKDIWMASYSPVLAMAVWFGNNDASILKHGTSSMPGPVVAKVMTYAHTVVYANDGKWKTGDWFTKPSGIQVVNNELYPSWWSKDQSSSEKMTFDKVSKKKATDYTPDAAKIELSVTKSTDPITKKVTYMASDVSYDPNSEDDVHKVSDQKPSVSIGVSSASGSTYTITATITPGTFPTVQSVTFKIGGATVTPTGSGNTYTYTGTLTSADTSPKTISVTALDNGYYEGSSSSATPVYGG